MMNPKRNDFNLSSRREILASLKGELLSLQGFKHASKNVVDVGLGKVNEAFPNEVFPIGAVHEFMASAPEDLAASTGFIAGIVSALLHNQGVVLWIGLSHTLFPPAVKLFGIEPEHILVVNPKREKDVLWVIEEALKCEGLGAVVGEVASLNFTESRRLQLAVEKSRVTGFILLRTARKQGTTACVTRWQISHLPSSLPDDMPGVGFPRWRVELLKVRNGRPGTWQLEWADGAFRHVPEIQIQNEEAQRKTG
jgi:protein ImuA